MYEHEALLNLLIEKGVFTKEEYLNRVKEEIRIARAEGRERFWQESKEDSSGERKRLDALSVVSTSDINILWPNGPR